MVFWRFKSPFSLNTKMVRFKRESIACAGYRNVLIITSWKTTRSGGRMEIRTAQDTTQRMRETTPFPKVKSRKNQSKMLTGRGSGGGNGST
jgi:hypothetical protein